MSFRVNLAHHKIRQIRKMTTSAHKDCIFTLPDGRRLGYTEYGSPSGRPLFYFHGYPSSRLEAEPVADMARKGNIRLIAVDRPGFGLSTPQPQRTILDWPNDVIELAESLSLTRFAVLGVSGGGPFALACAYALPKGMLTSVGLFASGPPWAAGAHHMSLIRRVASFMSRYTPTSLRVGLELFVRFSRWLANTSPVASRIDRWLEESNPKLKDISTDLDDESINLKPVQRSAAERRQNLIRILLDEPFAQGADAAVHEAKLLSSPDWGFEFEKVQYYPVNIWHGSADKNAPAVAIRYMAERLPHSVYHEFEGDTHYTMWKHVQQALSELIPDEPTDETSKGT